MSVSRNKPKKLAGLPREILFQHLHPLPRPHEVTIEFLEMHVWWWRKPDATLLVHLKDQSDDWPRCELYKLFKRLQPQDIPRSGQDAQRRFLELIHKTPELRSVFDPLWDHEYDAAHGYELEARNRGCYPDGVPYYQLSRAKRSKWLDKYWKLNLNSTPAIEEMGGSTCDPEKMTSWFCLAIGDSAPVSIRFNLRHGNSSLKDAFKERIMRERQLCGDAKPERLRAEDGSLIRKFMQEIAVERKRLGIPAPRNGGQDRRPLANRSFKAIENIDIKTHSNQSTAQDTRQRESAARRKLLSPEERQRQVDGWKLTVLQ